MKHRWATHGQLAEDSRASRTAPKCGLPEADNLLTLSDFMNKGGKFMTLSAPSCGSWFYGQRRMIEFLEAGLNEMKANVKSRWR